MPEEPPTTEPYAPTLGEKIIEEICVQGMFAIHQYTDGRVIVWAGNAPEQLETLVRQHQLEQKYAKACI